MRDEKSCRLGIDGDSNPANVIIKTKPCCAFQEFINMNIVNIKKLRFVEWGMGY